MRKYLQVVSLVCAGLALSACSDRGTHLALGTLERDRVILKATAAEIITQLPLHEGVLVNEGDLLVQLDDRRQRALVAKAEASLLSARAMLTKLQQGNRPEDIAAARSQVRGAEAQLIEAQKAFDRTQTLVTRQLAGAAELDSARAKRDSAQANLDKAQENLLLLTNGAREEDLQQAEAQVALAQAALALEQHNLDELSIRATRRARLDHLPKHLGERTQVGEALVTLLDEGAPYARVYVPGNPSAWNKGWRFRHGPRGWAYRAAHRAGALGLPGPGLHPLLRTQLHRPRAPDVPDGGATGRNSGRTAEWTASAS